MRLRVIYALLGYSMIGTEDDEVKTFVDGSIEWAAPLDA